VAEKLGLRQTEFDVAVVQPSRPAEEKDSSENYALRKADRRRNPTEVEHGVD
jgi:hypothetical protein